MNTSARLTRHPLARIATLTVLVAALVLFVVAAGPGHVAFHSGGIDAECVGCNLVLDEVAVAPVLSDALGESAEAPELVYRALFGARPVGPRASRAPPLG